MDYHDDDDMIDELADDVDANPILTPHHSISQRHRIVISSPSSPTTPPITSLSLSSSSSTLNHIPTKRKLRTKSSIISPNTKHDERDDISDDDWSLSKPDSIIDTDSSTNRSLRRSTRSSSITTTITATSTSTSSATTSTTTHNHNNHSSRITRRSSTSQKSKVDSTPPDSDMVIQRQEQVEHHLDLELIDSSSNPISIDNNNNNNNNNIDEEDMDDDEFLHHIRQEQKQTNQSGKKRNARANSTDTGTPEFGMDALDALIASRSKRPPTQTTTEEEKALKHAEQTRRRELLKQQRIEDLKETTIHRLLKKQASKKTRIEQADERRAEALAVQNYQRSLSSIRYIDTKSHTILALPKGMSLHQLLPTIHNNMNNHKDNNINNIYTHQCHRNGCHQPSKYKFQLQQRNDSTNVLTYACSLICYKQLQTNFSI